MFRLAKTAHWYLIHVIQLPLLILPWDTGCLGKTITKGIMLVFFISFTHTECGAEFYKKKVYLLQRKIYLKVCFRNFNTLIFCFKLTCFDNRLKYEYNIIVFVYFSEKFTGSAFTVLTNGTEPFCNATVIANSVSVPR